MLITLLILAIIVLIAAAVYLFMRNAPVFGGNVNRYRISSFERSPQYKKGKFHNRIPTKSIDSSFGSYFSLFMDHLKNNPKRRPPDDLPVFKPDPEQIRQVNEDTIIWLGHSTLLLKIDGKTMLVDPMLGPRSAPIPGLGAKRFKSTLTIKPQDLPFLDAVLISHDHYDHLDYRTVLDLSGKVGRYFVPLGVGSRLVRFGVPRELIQEFDWWEETEWQGIRLVCTPARHFSGRALGDKDTTLWSSWVIHGRSQRIFFSGDSGYDVHFSKIGELYGPFDWTLLECGQYDPRWEQIHMFPRQTLNAHLDLKGKYLLPIHWAAFALAMHGWTEPVELLAEESVRQGVKVAFPRIGEILSISKEDTVPVEKWWRTV